MIEQKIANEIYFLSRQSCPYFHCLHISRWPPRSSAIVTANCHIMYRPLKCDTLSHEHQILHAIEENNISYQFNVVSMTNSVINTKKNGIVSGTKPRKIFLCCRPHVQWPLWLAGDKVTMTGENSEAVPQ